MRRQELSGSVQRRGRLAWATLLHGIDPEAEPEKAQAVGSAHQALLSGVLVQWLIDPGRAPSASDLASGLRVVAEDMSSCLRLSARNAGRSARVYSAPVFVLILAVDLVGTVGRIPAGRRNLAGRYFPSVDRAAGTSAREAAWW